MSDISDALESAATGPKQTTIDGQSTTEFSPAEMADADQHIAEKVAHQRAKLPIRLLQLKPGGTT